VNTAPSAAAPLVAVVTPVYNGARFLAETMDCVQAQSYPNLVHIVHDNASSDATPEIIARYADARVPVIVARNAQTMPLAANWNAAVARTPADAKYFRVLCADDLIAPNFVERMVALAERNPTAIVVGCGLRHRGVDAETFWDADRELYKGREAARRYFDGKGLIIAHQTLMRRNALGLRDPFFDGALFATDTDACLDLLRHGDWAFTHEVLATTRDHEGTVSKTQVDRVKLQTAEFLALIERHAEFALGAEGGRRMVRRYRRYYLRQLLRWRLKMRDVYERHLAALKSYGPRPLGAQIVDAIADWPLARLGLRDVWRGYPFEPEPS
jgi:glycosyltransferase involved in cell wall biosynthesis